MAHKKAGGSSRNGRDSAGQRLGIKIFGGEEVDRRQDHCAPARHQMASRAAMSASAGTTPCSRWSTVGSSFVPKPRAAYSFRYFRQRRPRPSNTVDHRKSAGIQSNRRAQMGFEKGETGMPAPPFGFLAGALQMTLSREIVGTSDTAERSIPVLETERLTLRAPRHEDVKAITVAR